METVSEEQSEFSIVVKEIMSLQRERRELLASFTPGLSVWKKRRGLGEETTLVSRFAGKDYTAAAPVHQVPVQEMDTERASAQEQLGRYFDSVLQDTEDLTHHMLSMTSVVVKPDGAALSLYMADELVSSTSRLMDACEELYKDTGDNEQAEEVQENVFLDFYHKFLQSPLNYENELALLITKEEEEDYRKEVEKERKRLRKDWKENRAKFKQWQKKQKEMEKYDKKTKGREKYEKEKQKAMEKLRKEYPFMDEDLAEDDDQDEDQDLDQDQEKENLNLDPDSMEYLKKGMAVSEEFFADHRDSWNNVWGCKSTRCGAFRDITTLSPMHFTHYTKDTLTSASGGTGSTLQIYSIEILELKEGLKWPLKVYGVVAARDTVDRNRNILFSRSRRHYQELGENGSLCLTGPSRAIVALDPVYFDVDLSIEEGQDEYQDKVLITLSKRYDGTGTTLMFENSFCRAVLKLEQVSRAVQATILGVCVVEGEWPFEYGCRVACSLAAASADEVVLLDCRGDSTSNEVHVGSNGYLHLSRNVVSMQSQGTLKVVIRSYLKSGHAAQNWNFDFAAQQCQTSERECSVGTSKVKIVVAWSLLVKEKRDLLVDCPAVEP